MMTESTIALLFLAIISLSQGEIRDQLEREMELKPEFLSTNAGDCSELDCKSLFDLNMETGLLLAANAEKFSSLTIKLDDYECILQVRTYRYTSKSNWDAMMCTGMQCKCSGFDCSEPQADVLIGVMGYDANSMPLIASEDEKASCGGILADEIQISLTGEETFDIYELVLVDQDRGELHICSLILDSTSNSHYMMGRCTTARWFSLID